jgi:hypothetical protein
MDAILKTKELLKDEGGSAKITLNAKMKKFNKNMYQHHAKNKTSNPRVAKEKESEP